MLFKQLSRFIADYSKLVTRRVPRSKMAAAVTTSVCGKDVDTKVEGTLQEPEVKAENTQETTGEKRKLEEDDLTSSAKRERTDQAPVAEPETAPLKKKKVALLISYSGKGYFGLQKQRDVPTIEGVLGKALLRVGVISKLDEETPQKMSFQRAARTDKGVSAAGNLISLKMSMHLENFLEEINKVLPQQIKIQACIRVTKSFDSKNFCDRRTYSYLTPTFVFAPHTEPITEKYRVQDETITQVREIIKKFEGTHNFHNFTSGLKPTDASAKRYIISFKCGEPFVRDNMEFVQMTVHGQSFMLHHIRKMIGLTIAIVRGYCGEEVIEKSYSLIKMDVPKAPGNGLMLDELHYNHYNKRYGSDGIHDSLDWTNYREEINKFKEEYIYPDMIRAEKEDRSMMSWLPTLVNHDYDEIPSGKLANWKFKGVQNDENNKKEIFTPGETTHTSEEKEAKSSSTDVMDSVSDQDKTMDTVNSTDIQIADTRDMVVKSSEEVPSSCNTDTDQSAVNNKETDNKMEAS